MLLKAAVLVAVVALLYSLLYVQNTKQTLISPDQPFNNLRTADVQKQTCKQLNVDKLEEIVRQGQPVVLQECAHVQILSNIENLYDAVLTNTKVSQDPVFVPVNDLPGQLSTNTSRRDWYNMSTITLKELVDGDSFAQFSGEIISEFSSLLTEETETFNIHKNEPELSGMYMRTLWISSPGSAANIHFDRSYNFVTQLYGRKTWYLFGAWEASNLYIYSSKHPHYHQSQIDLLSANVEDLFPNFLHTRPFKVLLEPGDILYIPPYWSHFVYAQNLSISVSSMTPSREEITCSRAYGVNFQEFSDRPFDEKLKILMTAMNYMHIKLNMQLEDLLVYRYLYYWNEAIAGSKKFSCRGFLMDLPDEDLDLVVASVNRVLEYLTHERLQRGENRLCLAEWIERTVSNLIGVENLALFLRECLV